MAYDKNTDYQKLIQEAVANKDYTSAAKYEQQRNEKIADLNAAGGGNNQYGATTTNNYSVWLPGNMPSGYAGSSTGVGTYTADQDAIKSQMNQYSQDWYNATTQEEKDSLHAMNEYLGSLLGGSVAYDPTTGVWSGDAAKPQKVAASMPTFDYDYDTRPTYESNYQTRIDEMLNKILSRDAFSYNAEDDQLFQQYKNQYNREGNRAMNDTLASAAANAGGMNSYAITAAQQANNYYAAQLGDKIPELYQLAYDMYLQDIDNQVRDLGLLQQMDDTQYGRYRDTMNDWENDRDFAYNMYRDDMGDYQWQTGFDESSNQWWAGHNFDVVQAGVDNSYRQAQSEIDNKYRQEQADIANGQWDKAFASDEQAKAYEQAIALLSAGVSLTPAQMTAAGLTSAQVDKILSQFEQVAPPVADDDGYIPAGKELTFKGDVSTAKPGSKADTSKVDAALPKDKGSYDPFWDSVVDLGIGMVDASFLEELLEYGGLIETADGKVKWANGWNKDNYREKMDQSVKILFI